MRNPSPPLYWVVRARTVKKYLRRVLVMCDGMTEYKSVPPGTWVDSIKDASHFIALDAAEKALSYLAFDEATKPVIVAVKRKLTLSQKRVIARAAYRHAQTEEQRTAVKRGIYLDCKANESRLRYQARRSAGLCGKCGCEQPQRDHSMCEECLKLMRASSIARRQRNAAARKAAKDAQQGDLETGK